MNCLAYFERSEIQAVSLKLIEFCFKLTKKIKLKIKRLEETYPLIFGGVVGLKKG